MKRDAEERRALLQVLYEAGSAMRAKSVRSVMSQLGASVFWSTFMGHVEYMTEEDVIRCYPADGSKRKLTDIEQAEYVAKCKRLSYDAPECETVMLVIRQKGRHFMEGNADDVKGIARE